MEEGNGKGVVREGRGPVKWFNLDRGFGFVVLADGIDAFLHVSILQAGGIPVVREGDVLRCLVEEGPKGAMVSRVLEVSSGGSDHRPGFRPGPEVSGTVKFYCKHGSYGFIERDEGGDVYISRRCLSRSGVPAVVAGMQVTATTLVGAKGLVAERITLAEKAQPEAGRSEN